MNTFIVADAKFFNTDIDGVSKEQYNERVIKNWNETVGFNDLVLLMGEISRGSFEETQELFSQLKGKKKIIDYKTGNFSEQEWLKIGCNSVTCVNGAIAGTINNEESIVLFIASPRGIESIVKDNYAAAPCSTIPSKKRYEDRILNLSIEQWGYYPIEYRSVPKMIDNQILFEKMEDINE